MKKITMFLVVLCVISLFSFTALAGGNYPSTNADWDTQVTVNDDGSVTFSVDNDKVVESGVIGGIAWYYITIYDADQNFTADSNMTGTDNSPYELAQLDGVFEATVGESASKSKAYPFEEGETYYAYFLACDGTTWGWNYEPLEFVYSTTEPTGEATEAPAEEPTQTADVSTIAYALAAIAGCGALVIRKKK